MTLSIKSQNISRFKKQREGKKNLFGLEKTKGLCSFHIVSAELQAIWLHLTQPKNRAIVGKEDGYDSLHTLNVQSTSPVEFV